MVETRGEEIGRETILHLPVLGEESSLAETRRKQATIRADFENVRTDRDAARGPRILSAVSIALYSRESPRFSFSPSDSIGFSFREHDGISSQMVNLSQNLI